ncbi:MAG: lipopolysaccharide biosynthesis protein, partial [Kiritimatiellia bacterium]
LRWGGWAGMLAGLLLVEMVVLLVGVGWSRGDMRMRGRGLSRKRFLRLFRFGLDYQVAGGFLLLWRYAGEWSIKGLTGNTEYVGYYALAMGIYVAAESALQQLGVFSAPYLRRAGSGEEMLRRLMRRSAWLFAPGGLGVVLSFWFRKPFVTLLAGEAYLPAADLLPWMAIALCVYLPVPLYQARLLSEGRSRYHRITSCGRLLLFALTVFPCVYFMNLQGIACAMLVSNLGYTASLALGMDRNPLSAWSRRKAGSGY